MTASIETILYLKSHPLFSQFSDAEITAIVRVTKKRVYKPGELVCPVGNTLQNLLIVTKGNLESVIDGQTQACFMRESVFGIKELLFDLPLDSKIAASSSNGAECLLIRKSNFFTIIHECPILLVNYLSNCVDQKQDVYGAAR